MDPLFAGQARILGVRGRRRNCKGFDGTRGTEERGNPGWIPSVGNGREVEISSFDAELCEALASYGITVGDLPSQVSEALRARQSFTLVEGEQPEGLYKGRIDSQDLINKGRSTRTVNVMPSTG
jgi:hypothetical protein